MVSPDFEKLKYTALNEVNSAIRRLQSLQKHELVQSGLRAARAWKQEAEYRERMIEAGLGDYLDPDFIKQLPEPEPETKPAIDLAELESEERLLDAKNLAVRVVQALWLELDPEDKKYLLDWVDRNVGEDERFGERVKDEST